MKYISRFYFSIFLVLLTFLGNAQETATAKKDSIPVKKERYGLRLGVDLFKLTRSFYEEDYRVGIIWLPKLVMKTKPSMMTRSTLPQKERI